MSEIDTKLDAILDIESDIKEKTSIVKLPDRHENVETDYRYARENLYNLVESCLLYTSPSPRDNNR